MYSVTVPGAVPVRRRPEAAAVFNAKSSLSREDYTLTAKIYNPNVSSIMPALSRLGTSSDSDKPHPGKPYFNEIWKVATIGSLNPAPVDPTDAGTHDSITSNKILCARRLDTIAKSYTCK